MMTQNICLLFVTLFALTMGDTDFYEECPSPEGNLTEVTLNPPCTSDPCQIPFGVNVTATITFQTNQNVPNASLEIEAVITAVKKSGLWIPVPLPIIKYNYDINMCTGDGSLSCPLQANTQYVYNYTYSVPDNATFQGYKTNDTAYIVDDGTQQKIACFTYRVNVE